MKEKVLILCLFVFGVCFSQEEKKIGELTITESSKFKEKIKSDYILSFDTSDSGDMVLLRKGKKKLIIDKFDKQFSKTYTEVVKTAKNERCVGGFFLGEEVKFFTVLKPKKRERVLYCHTFNLITNKYAKYELFKKTMEKGGSLFYSRKRKETNFAVSPNGDFFVIATKNSKKSINSSSIHVYDVNNLELVYTKSYQKNEKDFYQHHSISMDDDTNIYSLGKMDVDGKYTFVLNKINRDHIKEMKIDLNDKYVKTLALSNYQNQLSLYGFYSEDYVGKIKGGCSFKIDKENLSITSEKMNELPLEVYKGLYGDKRAEKKKKKGKELKNFEEDYILVDEEDGSTYLLAEEFYITQVYVANANGGGYYRSQPHYNDILILKFNNEGDLDWGRGIYKKDQMPSYNAFLKDHKLHVILNTGINLKEQKNGRTKLSKGWLGIGPTALYDFVYSKSGEIERNKIQDNKRKGNTKYHPFLGAHQKEKLIMMSLYKSSRRFMVLE